MPVKIYEPVKSSDIEAIHWVDDNWKEIKSFLGNNLICEIFYLLFRFLKNKKN